MGLAADAIRAILADERLDEAGARDLLDAALCRNVDPIEHCVRRLGVPEPLAYRRAALWAGLEARTRIPPDPAGLPGTARLDALAGTRSHTVQTENGPVSYVAPGLAELLRLRQAVARHPGIAARLHIVSPTILRTHLARAAAPQLTESARQRLARRWPRASAHLDLGLPVRLGFALLVLVFFFTIAAAPLLGAAWLAALGGLVAAAPALMRLSAILAMRAEPLPEPAPVPEPDLPRYTVLLPLRDEAAMVPQLRRAVAALDYPPERLDAIFVVEADCPATLAAVAPCLADPRFSLIAVEPALPRTKPKAMNYALPLVRGAHVVVYDAEDRPEPDQLRRAAARFAADPDLACLQAELVVGNAAESPLAALFAGEYAGLFGILLPALAHWDLPVPLGGTSNHFRTGALRAAGGWDAFNVTEDADLGLRLARMGQKVETFASATIEDAPTSLGAWAAQRARWIKGWMQTTIVHNRRPLALLADLGPRRFVLFELMILGIILAPLAHLAFAAGALIAILTGRAIVPDAAWLAAIYLLVFTLGTFAAFAINVAGLARRRQYGSLPAQILLPLYWLLLAGATLRALSELVARPFHWAKTAHRPLSPEHQGEKPRR